VKLGKRVITEEHRVRIRVREVDMQFPMKGPKLKALPAARRDTWRNLNTLSLVKAGLAANNPVIFLTASGKPFTPNHLSWLARRYVTAADIGKSGACHIFRHTMATLMLEGGADIRYIQAMLGHVRLDTTQIYTHVSIRMLKQIHSSTHPAARLDSQELGVGTSQRGADAPETTQLAEAGVKK